MTEAAGGLSDTGRAAQEQAGAAWSEAKDQAREVAAAQQHAAAQSIGAFAAALREAARNAEDGSRTTASRLAEGVAERLEHVSGTLGRRDFSGVVREVESFARAQPAVFFGAAMAAGFVAIRVLKSRAPEARAAAGDAPDAERARQAAAQHDAF